MAPPSIGRAEQGRAAGGVASLQGDRSAVEPRPISPLPAPPNAAGPAVRRVGVLGNED